MSRAESMRIVADSRGRVRQLVYRGAAVFELCFTGRTPAEAGRVLQMDEASASRALVYFAVEKLAAAGLNQEGEKHVDGGEGGSLLARGFTVEEMDIACGLWDAAAERWTHAWMNRSGGMRDSWRDLAWKVYQAVSRAMEAGVVVRGKCGLGGAGGGV